MVRYRRSLVSFVRTLPMWLERPASDGAAEGSEGAAGSERAGAADDGGRSGLTAIDGGRA
jgi:hypothetical protein